MCEYPNVIQTEASMARTNRRVFGLGAGLAAAGFLASAHAQPLTLANPGFESPVLADNGFVFGITGWVVTGAAGVYNPTAAAYPAEAPGGANIGFLTCCTGPNPNNGAVSQTLTDVYVADTTYTLTVQSGIRLDDPNTVAQYRLVGANGSTALAVRSFSAMPARGTFRADTLEWDVFAGDAAVGRPITIRLLHGGGAGQWNVDDVSLVAAPLCLRIRTQPEDSQACTTGLTRMSARVAGTGPFTFTWQFENPSGTWNNLTSGGAGPSGSSQVVFSTSSDGKTSTLTILGFNTGDDTNYRLSVTTGCGDSEDSDPASFFFCAPDYVCDGFLDFLDLLEFLEVFDEGTPGADFNGDSFADFFDVLDYFDAFVEGC
jgi:hypothetical protein